MTKENVNAKAVLGLIKMLANVDSSYFEMFETLEYAYKNNHLNKEEDEAYESLRKSDLSIQEKFITLVFKERQKRLKEDAEIRKNDENTYVSLPQEEIDRLRSGF